MPYYKRLPWLALGPFKVGQQTVEGVGKCNSPLTLEKGECSLTLNELEINCIMNGGEIRQGGKCAMSFEGACRGMGGDTNSDGQCHMMRSLCMDMGAVFKEMMPEWDDASGQCRPKGCIEEACSLPEYSTKETCDEYKVGVSVLSSLLEGNQWDGQTCHLNVDETICSSIEGATFADDKCTMLFDTLPPLAEGCEGFGMQKEGDLCISVMQCPPGQVLGGKTCIRSLASEVQNNMIFLN